MLSKTCEKCGREFQKKPSEGMRYWHTKKYCSISCSKKGKRYRETKHCVYCGGEVEDYHTRVKYCSQECYWNDMRDGNIPETNKIRSIHGMGPATPRSKVSCPSCGTVFVTSEAKGQKYCCRECALEVTSIEKQSVDYSYKRLRVKRVECICEVCGCAFHVLPYEVKSRPCRYCSNKCQIRGIGLLKETSIEREFRKEMERRGIAYEAQYPIGRFIADFRVGDVAIECDGEYWHGLPEAIERDRRKDDFYRRLGFTVLRFTESEINDDVSGCVDVLECDIYASI